MPNYSAYNAAAAADSPPNIPPPPPSPPKPSTWDFLNPFETYESAYYAPYTPSRSSRELREEEGIPDLEDEHLAASASSSSSSSSSSSKAKATAKEKGIREDEDEPQYEPKRSVDKNKNAPPEEEEKNVVAEEINMPEEKSDNVVAIAAPLRYNDSSDAVLEIKVQFDKASESFVEVSKMLEVGKIPYHQRNSVYEAVSSRMICGVTSPSISKNELLVFEEDKGMSSGNLSSTLQKLYMWERKLYDEVKVEEKMRVILERECEHLRRLDERGAESHKLDSTQMSIRRLSTKIRIAIQVVESIANKISQLRDEELWPQVNQLIQGLMRMWRVMLECHRRQCHAVSEATIASGGSLSDAHMEATKQLELDLLDLIACFTSWMSAQKSFVKSLNGWLLKGLHDVPEETADGIAPFSPGRLGAPPVFVICNYWSQTIDQISDREVVEAMKAFASNVMGLWEEHNFQQRQRLMANSDMDRKLKIMEREEQQMRRAVEAQNKKLVLVSGHREVQHGHTAELSILQSNLRQIFEAMENFTATSVKAYEELHMRSEEERSSSRENVKAT